MLNKNHFLKEFIKKVNNNFQKLYHFNFLIIIFISKFTIGQINPGFETANISGWTANACNCTYATTTRNSSVSAATVTSPRSGTNHIEIDLGTDGGAWNINRSVDFTGRTITIPSDGVTYYIHAIGWAKRIVVGSTTSTLGSTEQIIIRNGSGGSINGTAITVTANNYTRMTANNGTTAATPAQTYFLRYLATNPSSTSRFKHYGDDFWIYYSTNQTTDITAPSSPSNLCVNAGSADNTLSWTNGTGDDQGYVDAVILRAPAGTALPTINNQRFLDASTPSYTSIGNWTVLSSSNSTGSYTDVGAAGIPYTYLVYLRDRALNYSATPAQFTTANAGLDQAICNQSTTTLAAQVTAPYTGTWEVQSGTGTITTPTAANSGVTGLSVPSNNILKWTTANSGTCSTYDLVNISIASALPPAPTTPNPADGSIISPMPVNLTWTGTGATSYTVLVETTNPPTTSFPAQTLAHFGMGALAPNTTYYWRVNANNACPGTTQGTIWSFTTLPNFTATAAGTDNTCSTGWDSGDTWTGFVKNISVSGLPTPLGTSSGQYVLNEVEVELGDNTCKKDLSTYYFRLTAPDNSTYIDFFPTNGLTTETNPIWIKIKFRDHTSLEMINEYTASIQSEYYPFNIGYYAIEQVNGFQSVFNGLDPNGTWKFAIKENTTDEISFKNVTLKFGPKLLIRDLTAVNNDNCINMQCIDNRAIVIGTNNNFLNGDPVFAGAGIASGFDGCDWNGANNNSAWFYFTASQATSKITISGMDPAAGDNDKYALQPIVFTYPNACVTPSDVPNGGCANDNTVNNRSYETAQGGGTSAPDAYYRGITANAEFNLSGLTPGQRYILYIDGNGGAASPFYIEGLNGMSTCDAVILLPIELVNFDAKLVDKVTVIDWMSAIERNNDYYTVERSSNGFDWEFLEKIDGAGNSSQNLSYVAYDFNPLIGISYYRLKQRDFNGKTTILGIRSIVNLNEIMVVPNPNTGVFAIGGLPKRGEKQITLLDITGQIVNTYFTEEDNLKIDISNKASGVYFVRIEGFEPIKIIKQ
ncbi:MAG: T9SS type A sorting domain-containing protein [Flavobacteriia bacterium]|jgi:hypothetical protein